MPAQFEQHRARPVNEGDTEHNSERTAHLHPERRQDEQEQNTSVHQ